jgi:hypothetical protein
MSCHFLFGDFACAHFAGNVGKKVSLIVCLFQPTVTSDQYNELIPNKKRQKDKGLPLDCLSTELNLLILEFVGPPRW